MKDSQSRQDARIHDLWTSLAGSQEVLDLSGLKEGLSKIDHPLRHANSLLSELIRRVDRDGDGRIQYSDFSKFVKHAEDELRRLFNSIDVDHNGKLTKDELRHAFAGAGISVASARLDDFFTNIDVNNDGVISFDEWRDFLLFIPADRPGLKAVFQYYTSTVKVNPEGDVHVSDETKRGAGTDFRFQSSLLKLFEKHPKPQIRHRPPDPQEASSDLDADEGGNGDAEPALVMSEAHSVAAASPESMLSATAKSAIHGSSYSPPAWWSSLIALLPVSLGYFIAGAVAGIVSRTTTAPLDRLKVYLIAQTNPTSKAMSAAREGAIVIASKHAAAPLRDACVALWRAGGMRSLFAGNGINVFKVMPESAIKFGGYEASKRFIANLEGHGDPQRIHPWSRFVAGGIGGIVSQLFAYPLDTLKFRMQCETVPNGLFGHQLLLQTAKNMWQTGGFNVFYRGLTWGLVGQFPYAAIDLGTFEGLKRYVVGRNMKRGFSEADAVPGNVTTAIIGGFSGALGASLVYPINLLRTRLQTQGTKEHPRTYNGIVDVTRQTIQGEGFRGLFKGITPNLVKVVPAVSITYVVYEGSKRALHLP